MADGVPFIDMANEIQGTSGAFVDPVHYSTAGVLRFGMTLATHLKDHLPPPVGMVPTLESCTTLWTLEEPVEFGLP